MERLARLLETSDIQKWAIKTGATFTPETKTQTQGRVINWYKISLNRKTVRIGVGLHGQDTEYILKQWDWQKSYSRMRGLTAQLTFYMLNEQVIKNTYAPPLLAEWCSRVGAKITKLEQSATYMIKTQEDIYYKVTAKNDGAYTVTFMANQNDTIVIYSVGQTIDPSITVHSQRELVDILNQFWYEPGIKDAGFGVKKLDPFCKLCGIIGKKIKTDSKNQIDTYILTTYGVLITLTVDRKKKEWLLNKAVVEDFCDLCFPLARTLDLEDKLMKSITVIYCENNNTERDNRVLTHKELDSLQKSLPAYGITGLKEHMTVVNEFLKGRKLSGAYTGTRVVQTSIKSKPLQMDIYNVNLDHLCSYEVWASENKYALVSKNNCILEVTTSQRDLVKALEAALRSRW